MSRKGNNARSPQKSAIATAARENLASSGKWQEWRSIDTRLSGFASLEEAITAWAERDDPQCYQVVAALAALGSRRGGDDDDAALAVVALLERGLVRVATNLADVCEVDDVAVSLWEVVKAAEPQLGSRAARFLLQRAGQRLIRPGSGLVSRLRTVSLEELLENRSRTDSPEKALFDCANAVEGAEPEDPSAELLDVLIWARRTGVVTAADLALLVEILDAEVSGWTRGEAHRLASQRHRVNARTIRRHQEQTAARLRAALPHYLAAIA